MGRRQGVEEGGCRSEAMLSFSRIEVFDDHDAPGNFAADVPVPDISVVSTLTQAPDSHFLKRVHKLVSPDVLRVSAALPAVAAFF